MKDFLFLKLLDRIKALFASMGIDYPMMRRILQLKLVMNGRRSSTVINRDKSDDKNSFYSSLILYAFLGLFFGVFMLLPYPLFLKMNLVLGMITFIILTAMISDFSSVLLDTQDRTILLTRPVDAKTLNAAKLMHIVYYLFCITMAVAGIALIISLFKYGFLFFLLMLVILALICSFTILITSILYFAILHFFSGEKLKDIINYFQIALSIFMTVSYQLIGRIFNFVDMKIQITLRWWNFLLPSSWFAAPFSIFFMKERGPYYVMLALTGVIVPVIALILYIKVAAPSFEKNLQKLTGGGAKVKAKNSSMMRGVCDLICFNREERAFFKFTCGMLKNERKLKLSLFPNLTLGVIMPFVMMLSFAGRSRSITEFLRLITSGKYYLFSYFSVLFYSTLFMLISSSESYKGAWIYRAMPVQNPGHVLKGAMKAFICKYVMPFFLLTCLIFIGLYGVRILPDMILVFFNMMFLMLLIFKLSRKELPFYKDFRAAQGGARLGVVFLSFGVCGGLAAAHYMLPARYAFGFALNLGVSGALFVILWFISFRISWKDIVRGAE